LISLAKLRNLILAPFQVRNKNRFVIQSLRENRLSANDVFAFSWKGKVNELRHITQELRIKLEKD